MLSGQDNLRTSACFFFPLLYNKKSWALFLLLKAPLVIFNDCLFFSFPFLTTTLKMYESCRVLFECSVFVPMIDALAHSLLCHLSLYFLTSKSFDLLMTLLQCKLSVCLHGFFVPFHIAIIHRTEEKKNLLLPGVFLYLPCCLLSDTQDWMCSLCTFGIRDRCSILHGCSL